MKQTLIPLFISLLIATGVLLVTMQFTPGTDTAAASPHAPLDKRWAYSIFLIPAIFLFIGFQQLARLQRYTRGAISTQGTITAIKTRVPYTLRGPSVTLCKPTIRFTDEAGHMHVFENRYEAPEPFLTPHHVGSDIEVLYFPNQPETALAMSKHWRRGPYGTLVVGVLFLVLFGAALLKL